MICSFDSRFSVLIEERPQQFILRNKAASQIDTDATSLCSNRMVMLECASAMLMR